MHRVSTRCQGCGDCRCIGATVWGWEAMVMDERDERRDEQEEPWQPERGLVTKLVTWGILLFMAAVVVAMVAILVWTALGGG